MRNQLKKINGVRSTFTGTFERYGFKNGYRGKQLTTILLKDIKDKYGKLRSDHLWFNLTKEFDVLPIEEGDRLQFDARVSEYTKGYNGYKWEVAIEKPLEQDYRLSRPTNIRKIECK
jgi:hypothetical protein